MKDVQQKTLSAGVEEIFKMQLERSRFLVKNFTDGNVQVKLGNNEGISIVGSGMFEVVFNNVVIRATNPDDYEFA